jgi:anaerobic magnesium-protoporphyrin IX monomethyl ester cyclase
MGMDIVLINPGDRKNVFQDLARDFAAIEPPFLVAVLAAYLRNKGFKVSVIDANAENITPEETTARVKSLDPLLAAVIVYGSNPSASTQNMTIAERICKSLKDGFAGRILLGGLHPSALPEMTLERGNVDFVIEGEGAITLEALLNVLKSKKDGYSGVPGLWYYQDNKICSNARAPLIEDLDEVLPVAAWDLLPMDKYKAHNWHCFGDLEKRAPYGALYTSLGCPYSCVFCCINAPFGKSGIRYRSPERVIEEIGVLVNTYGIRNLKIVDELFVLSEKHYMGIVEGIIANKYDLNIWAYARVDTIKFENLPRMKKAGINWLGLGIESANASVRNGANKQVKKDDITGIVRAIQAAGINVGANFIFGLPDDNIETMQETLKLAMDINAEWANFYCAMAYPGSKLYDIARKEGWELPKEWYGYSQYSYETLPLPTKYISAKEVLKFRDDAFHEYFSNRVYLNMLEKKFGPNVRAHIEEMTRTKLRRRMLE